MSSIHDPKSSFNYRQLDLAVDTLLKNIIQIRSVNDWAQHVGYSRAHFCRKFTEKFGENPKTVLRRMKYRKICRVIQSDWSATAYKVALDSGLHNEKALHKFLNRNFQTGFVTLKDTLKRDAFRARNYLSKVAEEPLMYLQNPKDQQPSKGSSFPGNTVTG